MSYVAKVPCRAAQLSPLGTALSPTLRSHRRPPPKRHLSPALERARIRDPAATPSHGAVRRLFAKQNHGRRSSITRGAAPPPSIESVVTAGWPVAYPRT